MEGPLSKWTNVIEGWQFRWFVLDDESGILSYYTSKEKIVKGQRRGCVRLKGAVVGIDDEDDSTFTITVDQKMFHFQAHDYEERDRWIRALEAAIQRHSEAFRHRAAKRPSVNLKSSVEVFESKIVQVDNYLQMIIEKISQLENCVKELEASGAKATVCRLLEMSNSLLDSFKHSIFLLQYAKNQILPPDAKLVPVLTISTEAINGAGQKVDDASSAANIIIDGTVTPVVSYSSSEEGDDLFYDTVEQKAIFSEAFDIHVEAEVDLQAEEQPLKVAGEDADQFPHVVNNEPIYCDVDFDGVYDDDAEDELEDTREHGSVIGHLLSQLSVGMDLTKIVLPTYILERRSLLEMYADFMTFPSLFECIPDKPSSEERMIAVVRWYLSTFYGGRRSGLAKKPYNPILGEVFNCYWNSAELDDPGETVSNSPFEGAKSNQFVFIGEQVSHHPPVSAFYVEHPGKRMQLNGQIWTRSKFLGLSIAVHNVGQTCLSLLDHDEQYAFTFPSGYGRSILTTPWVEFGGKCSIKCEKSGYWTDVEFLTKPFYNGKTHLMRADLFRPGEKGPFASIRGRWNGCMTIKTANSEDVFLDVRKLDPVKKICKPIADMKVNESRRLWRQVTSALKDKDVLLATKCKYWLEQRQRDAAKARLLKNVRWQPSFFEECAAMLGLVGRSAMVNGVRRNCYAAGLARLRRRFYRRQYPTVFVYPDGSMVTLRFDEPRKIVKLPVDLSTLDENERRERLASIYPVRQRMKSDDVKVAYSHEDYSFLWKDKN